MKMRIVLLIFAMMFSWVSVSALVADDANESKCKINFTERFRFVGWDNTINLDDEAKDPYSFTRHRTSLDMHWLPSANFELGFKVTNEFRVYLSPKDKDFDINEIFIDNLYLKWKNVASLPLTITLGRQNIVLGEGFVVQDPQPLTGSRSIYFNAARFDLSLGKNHSLTGFVTYVPETDNILPMINDLDQQLVEQAHTGIGLYYTGNFKPGKLEGYLIHKKTDANDQRPVESNIETVGARFITQLCSRTSMTVEGAYQFGDYGDEDRSAFGGYFHLDYKVPASVPLLKTVTLGGILLSGDDPATAKQEGWDPVFSRWPKWSESYIYTLVRENGVAYWSNLKSMYITLFSKFNDDISLKLSYFKLCALQYPTAIFPGGDGKDRGHLLIARLDIKINKHLDSHFVWEYFAPGNFYYDWADSCHWLRYELLLHI